MTAILVIVCALAGVANAKPKAVKVTIVSTMLSGTPGNGIGEWGVAALVEVDGKKILFDTGARPDTALKNVDEMKIDG